MRAPSFSPRYWLLSGAVGVACFVVFQLIVALGERPSDRVTLPNGLIITRTFGAQDYGTADDLFSNDGETRLARNIKFVCFNDRYAWVYSYDRGETGIFDAEVERRLHGLDVNEAFAVSGLGGNNQTCDGYYTAMVGLGLLYDGNTSPHLPTCNQRNSGNPALRDRKWFDRPCEDRQ